jgi:hypothetical protein
VAEAEEEGEEVVLSGLCFRSADWMEQRIKGRIEETNKEERGIVPWQE